MLQLGTLARCRSRSGRLEPLCERCASLVRRLAAEDDCRLHAALESLKAPRCAYLLLQRSTERLMGVSIRPVVAGSIDQTQHYAEEEGLQE